MTPRCDRLAVRQMQQRINASDGGDGDDAAIHDDGGASHDGGANDDDASGDDGDDGASAQSSRDRRHAASL